jgi:hypothetical protein
MDASLKGKAQTKVPKQKPIAAVGHAHHRDVTARAISMDQSKYVKDILVKPNMSSSKQSSLPMEPGFLSGLAHMESSLLTVW